MIRAAVFDIGGVLEIVDDDTWLDQWVDRWALRSSPRGDADLATYLANTLGAVRAELALAEFWDAYCGELDVPLRDLVASLRGRMLVALLSNSADGARQQEQLRYGFEELFDLLIYSHEVGVEKPDPTIYALTQERLGVLPHEIVFLDDRATAVEGARAAGWHAILHESTPASIAAIRQVISSPPQK